MDLVEVRNDKSSENGNHHHGIITEICPNNMLNVSVGDNNIISVSRDKVQKWVSITANAPVSKISPKSKKRLLRLPKLEGIDAECAALVKVKSKSPKNSRKHSKQSGLNEP